MRNARRSPPLGRLVALLLVAGLLGAFALFGGWSLGAALWGDGDPDAQPLPLATSRLGGAPGPLQAIAAPQATATPVPTPTPEPPPEPRPVLATRRLVTYYGNPLAEVMGILGEPPRSRMLERLRQQAAAYQQIDGRPVQGALHFITPVAQAAAGADGMYRFRMDTELIEEGANVAEEQGLLFFLDVQVGRSSVQEEVEVLRPFLTRHHVHLALDPEFAMSPTTFPGRQIGTIDAADINWTIEYLAEIALTHRFENRVLIVHQFTDDMIRNKDQIQTNPRVDLAIMMDVFGPPGLKISQYNRYITEQPVDYAGFKLFYKQDRPLMSPADVLAMDTPPDVVTYQ